MILAISSYERGFFVGVGCMLLLAIGLLLAHR